jgi:hypothetical protein
MRATKSHISPNLVVRVARTSTFKGVTYLPNYNRWHAAIVHEDKRHSLGDYVNERESAMAYDSAALHFFGENACCNFPKFATPLPPKAIRAQATHLFKQRASSTFQGVNLHKGTGRWRAFYRLGGSSKHIGYFDTEEQAALAASSHRLQSGGSV